MLTFLRKIRKPLFESNSIQKYIVYAVGEILLVMIGILLALQVNNWNELSKESKKEKQFLKGIMADLRKDSIELESIIAMHDIRCAYFRLIDPEFRSFNEIPVTQIDTSLNFMMLFSRGRSFRTNSGTYNSMISDGQAQLMTNRRLFNDLQNIYTAGIPHILSIYESLKDINVNLSMKWTEQIRYPPYDYLSQIDDRELIADLNYLHRFLNTYSGILRRQLRRITEAIQNIQIEISNKD